MLSQRKASSIKTYFLVQIVQHMTKNFYTVGDCRLCSLKASLINYNANSKNLIIFH